MIKGIKSVFVFSLVIYFVLSLFNEGISLPSSILYLLLTVVMLSITSLMACPILSFLTVKCKFPTFLLMSTLMMVGILFLFKMFMPDFYIDTYTFSGLDLGSMRVESFEVIPLISICVVSFLCSTICGIYRELDRD